MLTGRIIMARIIPGISSNDKPTMKAVDVRDEDEEEALDEHDRVIVGQIETLRRRVLTSSKHNKVCKQMLEDKLYDLQRAVAVLGEAHSESDCGVSLPQVKRQRLDHCKEVILANMTLDDGMYESLLANHVLNKDQVDDLKSLGTPRKQCEFLLELITLVGNEAFRGFLCALCETNQDYLFDILTNEIDVTTPNYCEDSWESCYLGKPDIATLPVSCFPRHKKNILIDLLSKPGDKFVFVNGVPVKSMCEVYQKALVKNHVRLSRELFAELLFDLLIDDKILTSDVTEGIIMLDSRHRMNQVLLHILPMLGDEAFVSFMDALRKTGQDHLARLLDEYVRSRSEETGCSPL